MNNHPHKQIWAIAGPAILANSSAPLVGLVVFGGSILIWQRGVRNYASTGS